MTTLAEVQERIAHFTTLLRRARVVQDGTKAQVEEQLRLLAEKVANKPVSLAEAGGARLVRFEDHTGGCSGSSVGGVGLHGDEDASIEFDEHLRQEWDAMCWASRHDMSGEEMLLITEQTMRTLTAAYRCPRPDAVMKYWRFLVRRRQQQACTRPACAPLEAAAERNAGAVVSSTAKASQRTEALPQGVEAYNYSPEVASPTAAMWQAPASPSPENGSARGGSVRAASRTGTSRVDAKSTRGPKTLRSSDSFVNPNGWVK